nr:outer membrane beta-barrel protein [Pedobacter panaciterrae]
MEHTDKGLEVIKSLLQNNEEAYKQGSWESFLKQQPAKNKTFGWLWFSGIAATLLLGGFVIFFSYNPEPSQLAQVKVKPIQQELINESPFVKHNKIIPNPINIKKEKSEVLTASSTSPEKNKPAPDSTVQTLVKPKEEQAAKDRLGKNRKTGPYTAYQETENREYARKKDSWTVGMGMATDFSNSKKLGLAFEAVVGYALNSKITIMLGAGYRETSALKDNNGQISGASNEKQLESASVRIKGIEIPLGLRYNVNQRLYARVGVSAFATIKQSGELTYLSSVSYTQSVVDPNGEVYDKIFTSEERSVINLEDQPQNKEKYKGFVNISFGYKYPILKNKTITLEPFVRFPMQRSKIEDVKLSTAGIRLGIDF